MAKKTVKKKKVSAEKLEEVLSAPASTEIPPAEAVPVQKEVEPQAGTWAWAMVRLEEGHKLWRPALFRGYVKFTLPDQVGHMTEKFLFYSSAQGDERHPWYPDVDDRTASDWAVKGP